MNHLRNALYTLHPDSGTDPRHAQGVLVGAVAAIMEVKGCDWTEAMNVIMPHLPSKIMRAAVPDSWTLCLRDRLTY
jgi:hypothetical protein